MALEDLSCKGALRSADTPPLLLKRFTGSLRGEPTVLDLFSGAGGFSLGFERAGFRVLAGLDLDEGAAEVFTRNFSESGFVLGDARGVSAEDLLEAASFHRPEVITAGVPCQGFSLHNRKRRSDDERNYLFLEVVRLAEALKPRAVVVENVPGMASLRRRETDRSFVHEVARALDAIGYTVHHARLNSADYGVPQTRERLFFVALERGLTFRWPAPLRGPRSPKGLPYVTVAEAIGDLPPLAPGERASRYTSEPQGDYALAMREGARELKDHEAPRHDPKTLERIAKARPGEPVYESFKQRVRLDPNRPSPTLVAGGVRPQFFFAHPFQDRGLTVRERARLQSFPDTFAFEVGLVRGRVLTGNAVPPLLAEALARELARSLRGGGS